MPAIATELLKSITALLVLIVPGYVAMCQYNRFFSVLKKDPLEIIIRSTIWSFVIYSLLVLLPNKLFDISLFTKKYLNLTLNTPANQFDFSLLTDYLFILIGAYVIGFLFGFISVKFLDPLISIITGRTSNLRAWDDFFTQKGQAATENGVFLSMDDGTQWIGRLKCASESHDNNEIWIYDVRKYDDEHNFVFQTVFSDMLVSFDHVRRICILKPAIQTDSTAIDNPTHQ